jgi:hypothetical protein
MNLLWTESAWEEYAYWQKTDQKTLEAINDLIKDIKRDPIKGLGNRSPSNMPSKAIGPAPSITRIVLSIGSLAPATQSKSKSFNAAIITSGSPLFRLRSATASCLCPALDGSRKQPGESSNASL